MLPIAYRLLPNLPIAECMLPIACCLLTAKVIHFPAHKFSGYQKYLLWPAKFAVGARAPSDTKVVGHQIFRVTKSASCGQLNSSLGSPELSLTGWVNNILFINIYIYIYIIYI